MSCSLLLMKILQRMIPVMELDMLPALVVEYEKDILIQNVW